MDGWMFFDKLCAIYLKIEPACKVTINLWIYKKTRKKKKTISILQTGRLSIYSYYSGRACLEIAQIEISYLSLILTVILTDRKIIPIRNRRRFLNF